MNYISFNIDNLSLEELKAKYRSMRYSYGSRIEFNKKFNFEVWNETELSEIKNTMDLLDEKIKELEGKQ